jgi:acyl-CoA synthetase (NDP forming)
LIVGFTYRSLQEGMVRYLLDRGLPIYQDPERAVRAMAAVLHYYQMRDSIVKSDV